MPWAPMEKKEQDFYKSVSDKNEICSLALIKIDRITFLTIACYEFDIDIWSQVHKSNHI